MLRDYPTPLLAWTWQDAQIEQPALLDDALDDIATRGFSAVLAMLRGCRYAVGDPLVIAAAKHAAEAAHRRGLAFWFALDPRLDQGRLTALPGGRATYLLTGREASGALPCEGPIDAGGCYSVRIDYAAPRGQHMLSQVAFECDPVGVERVFAYRKSPDGTLLAGPPHDVTAGARLFVQRGAGYLEIFGRVPGLASAGWYALALPRCISTYPELGAETVRSAMLDLYRAYHSAGVVLDGVFWDEIGYVTGFGSDRCRLPYGEAIRAGFAARTGDDLAGALPHLLLDDGAGHATRVRRAYYAAVQDVVVATQERCYAEARRLWGAGVESGIHQTWHQDADDLPHGSGDWWRGSIALSGGFTDVGDADRTDQAEHRDEILAMTVTAVSLARYHERPLAICNLWGVDYGEDGSRTPAGVLDWWAHLLSAFGVAWLAHTYGPNGYVDRFTGWGPGYPDHPTWDRFGTVNGRVARLREITGGALPEANVAVVYPLETLARIGDARANTVARDAWRVVSRLIRRGIAVDVISPTLFAGGEVGDGGVCLPTPRGPRHYAAVVYPHPDTLQPAEVDQIEALRAIAVPVLLLGMSPRETTDGRPIDTARLSVGPSTHGRRPSPAGYLGDLIDDMGAGIGLLPRLVLAPPGAVANLFHRADGTTALVVVPSVFGTAVDGEVRAGPLKLELSGLTGVAAFRWDREGRPLERVVHDGAASVPEVVAR